MKSLIMVIVLFIFCCCNDSRKSNKADNILLLNNPRNNNNGKSIDYGVLSEQIEHYSLTEQDYKLIAQNNIKSLLIHIFNSWEIDSPFKATSFDSVIFIKTIVNDNININLYRVVLNSNIPEVYNHELLLLIPINCNKVHIIFSRDYKLLKVRKESNDEFVGSNISYRGIGYFGAFKIHDCELVPMYISPFKSLVTNINCNYYKGDTLNIQNTDIDNDGYLDLNFTGLKYINCTSDSDESYIANPYWRKVSYKAIFNAIKEIWE